jgi:hypothetical protein
MPIPRYIMMPFVFVFIFLLYIPDGRTQEEPGEVFEWINPSGGINWTTGSILAEGVGIPPENSPSQAAASAMACRAAVVVAQRNLLEIVKGVRVESETLVEDFMLKSDVIRTAVSGVIQGAVIKSRKIEDDGSCIVTLEIPVAGKIASHIYEDMLLSSRKFMFNDTIAGRVSGIMRFFFSVAYAATKNESQAPCKKDINIIFKRLERLEKQIQVETFKTARIFAEKDPTGIIIDARGINMVPSMSPKIRGWNSDVVYPDDKHKAEARKSGRLISLFMNDIILAQNHPRVGSRPLVLKGLKSYGNSFTEIVLGKESTYELVSVVKKGILDNAEVILVTD